MPPQRPRLRLHQVSPRDRVRPATGPHLRAGLVGLAILLAGCSAGNASQSPPAEPTPAPTLSQSSATPVIAPESIPDRSVTTIRVDLPAATPGRIVATADALWVASTTGLWRVDPTTNRVTKRVSLGLAPDFLAVGFNALWVTSYDAQVVLRLDPASGRVLARIPAGLPQGIVATAEGMWVANHHAGTVTLIDPATNKASSVVSVGPAGPGGPQGMTVINGKVWVGMFGAAAVAAIDPATRTVTKTVVNVPAPCGDMAASDGNLWISECGEQKSVDQVDLATGQILRNTWVGGYVGSPIPVAGGVWLPIDGAARLLKLSDATGQPVDAIGLPDCASADVSAASVAFGSVWIVCGASLMRLAPAELP